MEIHDDAKGIEDAWQIDGEKVIHYHRLERNTLFMPDEGEHHCPIPIELLSKVRQSESIDDEGIKLNLVEDNWTFKIDTLPSTFRDPWKGTTTSTIKIECDVRGHATSLDDKIES